MTKKVVREPYDIFLCVLNDRGNAWFDGKSHILFLTFDLVQFLPFVKLASRSTMTELIVKIIYFHVYCVLERHIRPSNFLYNFDLIVAP